MDIAKHWIKNYVRDVCDLIYLAQNKNETSQ